MRRRTWAPFKFTFSEEEEKQTEEVAEILNNISIGDFVKETEEQELLSDDEGKENIPETELRKDPIHENRTSFVFCTFLVSDDENKSSDTIILSRSPSTSEKVVKIDEIVPETKPPLVPKSIVPNTPIFGNLKAPKNTPQSAFKKSLTTSSTGRPGSSSFTPNRMGFDLTESLKKRPTWKVHTGKLKPLGTYTPEARKNFDRVQKIQNERQDARKTSMQKLNTKVKVFEKARQVSQSKALERKLPESTTD